MFKSDILYYFINIIIMYKSSINPVIYNQFHVDRTPFQQTIVNRIPENALYKRTLIY